jgi:membrane-associated protease RseP (regulator of RpoE activity)
MASVNFAEGIDIIYVGENSPAEEIDLSPGIVIKNINNTEIKDISDFYYALENTSAGQTINISFYKKENLYTKRVVLDDKYNYTDNKSHLGKGYLGVGPNLYGGFLKAIKNPFYQFPDGFLLLYSLPILGYFWGYNPIASPFTDSYIITGPLSIIPSELFWGIISALYWIFWLNLAVGIFNVLPIIPLDGGFLFNDAIGSFLERIKKSLSDDEREKIVKNISLITSLIILFIFLFPWLIKYL